MTAVYGLLIGALWCGGTVLQWPALKWWAFALAVPLLLIGTIEAIA